MTGTEKETTCSYIKSAAAIMRSVLKLLSEAGADHWIREEASYCLKVLRPYIEEQERRLLAYVEEIQDQKALRRSTMALVREGEMFMPGGPLAVGDWDQKLVIGWCVAGLSFLERDFKGTLEKERAATPDGESTV